MLARFSFDGDLIALVSSRRKVRSLPLQFPQADSP